CATLRLDADRCLPRRICFVRHYCIGNCVALSGYAAWPREVPSRRHERSTETVSRHCAAIDCSVRTGFVWRRIRDRLPARFVAFSEVWSVASNGRRYFFWDAGFVRPLTIGVASSGSALWAYRDDGIHAHSSEPVPCFGSIHAKCAVG